VQFLTKRKKSCGAATFGSAREAYRRPAISFVPVPCRRRDGQSLTVQKYYHCDWLGM
jgi:hypothetical protein